MESYTILKNLRYQIFKPVYGKVKYDSNFSKFAYLLWDGLCIRENTIL